MPSFIFNWCNVINPWSGFFRNCTWHSPSFISLIWMKHWSNQLGPPPANANNHVQQWPPARAQSSYQGEEQQINTEDIKGNRSIGCRQGGDGVFGQAASRHPDVWQADIRFCLCVCSCLRGKGQAPRKCVIIKRALAYGRHRLHAGWFQRSHRGVVEGEKRMCCLFCNIYNVTMGPHIKESFSWLLGFSAINGSALQPL